MSTKTKIWLLTLCVSLLVSGFNVSPVRAAQHLIEFETVRVGYSFSPYHQPYEELGVIIGGLGDPRIVDSFLATSGRTLRNAPAPGSEFGSADQDLDITFQGFTSDRVSVLVGTDDTADYTIVTRLEGYQTVGGIHTLVDADQKTHGPGVLSAPIHPLTVESSNGAIDFVRITYGTAGASEVIDDLEISVWEGDPPQPPEDAQPPAVHITHPGDMSTVSTRGVSGYVEDNLGIGSTVRVTTPLETRDVPVIGPTIRDGTLRYFFADFFDFSPGNNVIYVQAQDAGGNSDTATAEITYEPPDYPPPPPEWPATLDIEASGMEVTQVIQGWGKIGDTPYDVENHTRTIAGKRTLVRVYGEAAGTDIDIPGVRCMLRAYRGGEELPGSPIYSVNQVTLVPGENYYQQRLDPAKSFNFYLPPEWIEPGTVRLEATVNPYSGIPEQMGAYDVYNTVVEDQTFYDTEEFCVLVYPIRSRQEGDVTPTWSECIDNISLMRQIYPVSPSKFQVYNQGTLITDRELNTGDNDDDDYNLSKLAHAFRRTLGLYYGSAYALPCTNVVYLGLTDDTVTHRGMTTGDRPVSVSVASNNFFYRLKTAHESGHAQGLGHVQGCDDPDDPYEPYPPYRDAISGTHYFAASIGDWGVDIHDDNTFDLVDPATQGDVMSYCGSDRWMSVYTWRWLSDHFGASLRSAAQATKALIDRQPNAPPAPHLQISGLLGSDNFGVLDPAWGVTKAAGSWDYAGEGAYTIELRDGASNVLFTRHFDPDPAQDLPGYSYFDEILPHESGTEQIRLSGGSLTTPRYVNAGLSKPDVDLISPNGGEDWEATGSREIYWTASDADGDDLTYTVFYSHDNGQTWRVLATDLEETGLTVTLDELPGGQDTCLVRVAATDGINQETGDSEAPFTKEGFPPVVHIISPEPVSIFAYDDLVVFEGIVTDGEDGTLAEENIQWVSDLDGPLGTGPVVSARYLSSGLHQITLQVTDSEGMTGNDVLGVYILPSYYVWLPFAVR